MEERLKELLVYFENKYTDAANADIYAAYHDCWEQLDKIVNPGAWETSDFDEQNPPT